VNTTQIMDATALAVLAAQSGWIGLLYRRMGRLRSALDSAGDVIGQLDAASRRLDASAGDIAQKVRDGIGEVDGKITACRRVAQELNAASRQAEEVATRLDQALRQNRKLQAARAAAPPRSLAEPLGLAERLAGRPAATVLEHAAPEPLLALPDPALSPERLAEVAVERLLAAEMIFPAPPELPVPAERRVFRLTLD
jgi:ABC-type transporter Mla subunit MlaD